MTYRFGVRMYGEEAMIAMICEGCRQKRPHGVRCKYCVPAPKVEKKHTSIGALIGFCALIGYSVFYVGHAIIHALGIAFGFPCP